MAGHAPRSGTVLPRRVAPARRAETLAQPRERAGLGQQRWQRREVRYPLAALPALPRYALACPRRRGRWLRRGDRDAPRPTPCRTPGQPPARRGVPGSRGGATRPVAARRRSPGRRRACLPARAGGGRTGRRARSRSAPRDAGLRRPRRPTTGPCRGRSARRSRRREPCRRGPAPGRRRAATPRARPAPPSPVMSPGGGRRGSDPWRRPPDPRSARCPERSRRRRRPRG